MSAAKPLTFEQIRDISASKDGRFTIIDVRRPDEYSAGHIANAHNIPVADLKQALALPASEFKSQYGFDLPAANSPDHNVAVYCQKGGRAGMAVSALSAASYSDNLYAYYPGWGEYSSKQ
ncbi:Rhodanese-like protein [Martensiomyces pterosporus]|nr:Rhodanese-like protein [Martensiomyces pterosporus]